MPFTDLAPEQLADYRPELPEPAGFDDFWRETLAEARAAGADTPATYEPVDSALRTVDVFDVRFPGWNGEPVAAWLLLPRGATGPLPAMVQYIGYSGGRGLHTDRLLWSAAGYAHLVVDSRGQGHDTPDTDRGTASQYVHGFMTRGIDDARHHYFRRLITDSVRAVDALRAHPAVDPARIGTVGNSQGGALSLAAAGITGLLGEQLAAALVDVPFLCHIQRGADLASSGPYLELVEYLRAHSPHRAEETFAVLNHFDGIHFARRATAPALFSVGLMDPVCPPSTVYAAHHAWAADDKELTVWRYADHSGGAGAQSAKQLDWLAARGVN